MTIEQRIGLNCALIGLAILIVAALLFSLLGSKT